MGWRKPPVAAPESKPANDRKDRSSGSGNVLKGKELAAARQIAREALDEDLRAIEIYGP